MAGPLISIGSKFVASALKKAASKPGTKADELLKVRKKRLAEDRASTSESLPSKKERKLESQLREKGAIPGTKETIKRGMSLEESPLTKGEKTKLESLSKKLAKTDSEDAENALMDYSEKLISKYGSGVEDIVDKLMKNVFTTKKAYGGRVQNKPKKQSKSKGNVVKRSSGGSVAQRGMGATNRGGGCTSTK
jgi:hypothetical protein